MESYLQYTLKERGTFPVIIGVLAFGAASALITLQYTQSSQDIAADSDAMLRILVLVLHYSCALLVGGEAVIPALGGKQWWYSTAVIASGFLGTLMQTALLGSLAASSDSEFHWAIGTLAAQVSANSVMVSFIFSDVARNRSQNNTSNKMGYETVYTAKRSPSNIVLRLIS